LLSPWPVPFIENDTYYYAYQPTLPDYVATDWTTARKKVKESTMANIAVSWDYSESSHQKFVPVLKMFLTSLPDSWRFQIKCQSRLIHYYYEDPVLREAVNSGRVFLELLTWTTMIGYTVQQLDFSYWMGIQGDNILTFQDDTVLCRKSPYSIDDFVGYDYIGGPWCDRNLSGGNSGLSLRSRAAIVELLLNFHRESKLTKKRYSEDVIISRKMEEYNKNHTSNAYNISSRKEGQRFSVDTVYYSQPFGVHKPWLYLTKEKYLKLKEFCPELEMIEPEDKKTFESQIGRNSAKCNVPDP